MSLITRPESQNEKRIQAEEYRHEHREIFFIFNVVVCYREMPAVDYQGYQYRRQHNDYHFGQREGYRIGDLREHPAHTRIRVLYQKIRERGDKRADQMQDRAENGKASEYFKIQRGGFYKIPRLTEQVFLRLFFFFICISVFLGSELLADRAFFVIRAVFDLFVH